MTEAHRACGTGTLGEHDGARPVLGATEWLRLVATPTFATMAVLTGLGTSPIHSLCSSDHGAQLSGMIVMYLLMSVFHLPPWLNLICGPPHNGQARERTSR